VNAVALASDAATAAAGAAAAALAGGECATTSFVAATASATAAAAAYVGCFLSYSVMCTCPSEAAAPCAALYEHCLAQQKTLHHDVLVYDLEPLCPPMQASQNNQASAQAAANSAYA
jgi:hypothetical protein